MRSVTVALLLFALAKPVSAQSTHGIYGPGCQSPNGGTIKGVAIDDSTGKPVGHVGIVLVDIGCAMSTASDGTILFENVPPGIHSMSARSLWYSKRTRVRVETFARATTKTEFRLQPANDILDCLDDSRCAEILKPDSASLAGLTDAEQMREVAIRTIYAMVDYRDHMVMCIGDSSAVVTAALKKRFKGAVAAEECGMSDPKDPFGGKNHLIHIASGKSAAGYMSGRAKMIDPDTFDGEPSYYMNPLGAGGWDCRFVRRGRFWVAKSCRMTWIS
jgi:hypothetical protein